MSKKFGLALALGLSGSFIATGAAMAQVAGQYDGTSADGQSVSITVAFDSGTGFYQIIGATVWYNAMCTGAGTGFFVNEGLGWAPGTEISGGTAQMTYTGNEQNILANLKFRSFTNTFTGNIDTRVAALIPNGAARPNRVMKCESDFQQLNLHYTGPAMAGPLPKGASIRLEAKH
jgi:hypothetical protein